MYNINDTNIMIKHLCNIFLYITNEHHLCNIFLYITNEHHSCI